MTGTMAPYLYHPDVSHSVGRNPVNNVPPTATCQSRLFLIEPLPHVQTHSLLNKEVYTYNTMFTKQNYSAEVKFSISNNLALDKTHWLRHCHCAKLVQQLKQIT